MAKDQARMMVGKLARAQLVPCKRSFALQVYIISQKVVIAIKTAIGCGEGILMILLGKTRFPTIPR